MQYRWVIRQLLPHMMRVRCRQPRMNSAAANVNKQLGPATHHVLDVSKVPHALGLLCPGVPNHCIWEPCLLDHNAVPSSMVFDLRATPASLTRRQLGDCGTSGSMLQLTRPCPPPNHRSIARQTVSSLRAAAQDVRCSSKQLARPCCGFGSMAAACWMPMQGLAMPACTVARSVPVAERECRRRCGQTRHRCAEPCPWEQPRPYCWCCPACRSPADPSPAPALQHQHGVLQSWTVFSLCRASTGGLALPEALDCRGCVWSAGGQLCARHGPRGKQAVLVACKQLSCMLSSTQAQQVHGLA